MAFARLSPEWQTLRDALQAEIHSERQEALAREQRLYAIVDLAASGHADDWLDYLQQLTGAVSLFADQPEADADAQAPWLLPMDDNRLALQRVLDEALASRNAIWIVSALSTAELAVRLSRRLTAVMEVDSHKPVPPSLLFRYYDTRLFDGWWNSLADDEKQCFGAVGKKWLQLGVDYKLHAYSLSGAPTDDPLQSPWVVTPPQHDALVDYSERHQLMDFLAKRQPDHFLPLSLAEQWQFVSRHDADAKARHIHTLKDRLKYCEQALKAG